PRLLAGLAQGFEEILSIDIVVINVLPSISSAHQLIDGSWIFHSDFARHGSSLTRIPNPSRVYFTLLRD
ncbi:MAG: hypothetical protein JWN25_3463, partial [Verrucomicrobiales bacterium]|nr:hypothetical protein [Verrucomicrobiales bacterium]